MIDKEKERWILSSTSEFQSRLNKEKERKYLDCNYDSTRRRKMYYSLVPSSSNLSSNCSRQGEGSRILSSASEFQSRLNLTFLLFNLSSNYDETRRGRVESPFNLTLRIWVPIVIDKEKEVGYSLVDSSFNHDCTSHSSCSISVPIVIDKEKEEEILPYEN